MNKNYEHTRQAGLLMPLASLPNRHGVGDFGKQTKDFLKLIHTMGFRLWQILPLNPIGYGHSPYQPFSSLLIDEIYLSLDDLIYEGLLEKVPSYCQNYAHLNYEKIRIFKRQYIRRAYLNATLKKPKLIKKIKKEMKDYYLDAVFMAFKKHNNDLPWPEWKEEEINWINDQKLSLDPYLEEINYQLFVQYFLKKGWHKIKKEAHKLGIQIIGDLPFYVGHDSSDCYANQKYFYLNKVGYPKLIAGVAPDYFSKLGQRWGNPVFNFEELKKDRYAFLINRLKICGELYDYIRLDHFRAFDTYYVIDAKYKTARQGEWKLGPSYDFFDELFLTFDKTRLIAEDLGDLRPEVLKLRDDYSLPGMDLLQFSILDEKSLLNKRNVYYIGTHDNETLKGWYLNLKPLEKQKLKKILKQFNYPGDIYDQLLLFALKQEHPFCILSLSDLLKLDNKARLNVPGIINDFNWTYRLKSLDSLKAITKDVKILLLMSKRI
ncbi:MAG: 4-alpha-glucanotransferase [Bacilli bacterium]